MTTTTCSGRETMTTTTDSDELIARARKMRKNPTRAERMMWAKLRGKQLEGRKFRRQHVLQPYIVDFYCHAENLVVEVDGLSHSGPDKAVRDERRDQYLEDRYDVEILRFTDGEVIDDREGVVRKIAVVMEEGG